MATCIFDFWNVPVRNPTTKIGSNLRQSLSRVCRHFLNILLGVVFINNSAHLRTKPGLMCAILIINAFSRKGDRYDGQFKSLSHFIGAIRVQSWLVHVIHFVVLFCSVAGAAWIYPVIEKNCGTRKRCESRTMCSI